MVPIWLQPLNSLSPLFPRGAASLGAALCASLKAGSGASDSEPFRGTRGGKPFDLYSTLLNVRYLRVQGRTRTQLRRIQRPFLSSTGRGAIFLFGKTKRRWGARRPPLPGADTGGRRAPQPRPWRAVAKQAREGHLRQGGRTVSLFAQDRKEKWVLICATHRLQTPYIYKRKHLWHSSKKTKTASCICARH